MSKIIDRTGKGAAISQAENDSNLESLHGVNLAIAGTTHTVDIDNQGDTLEFLNTGAVTVTLDLIATILAAAHTASFKVTLYNAAIGDVVLNVSGADTITVGLSSLTLSPADFVTLQTDSTSGIWNIINSADARKVGGIYAQSFLRSDAADTATGLITFTANNIHNGNETFNGDVDLAGTWAIGGVAVSSTAAELNELAGNAVDAADFTKLSQVTATSGELNITDGLTVTTAELNIVDGSNSASAIAASGTDRVVYNDGGTMRQVALTTLDTYFSATTKTLSNKTLASPKFTGGQFATFNVSSTGTISNAPSGWSISKGTTGSYTLTHNLGLTAGRPVLLVYDQSGTGKYLVATRSTETTNAITYIIRDVVAGSSIDAAHTVFFTRGDIGE